MTREEAVSFIRTYRSTARRWTMVITSFEDGDADVLRRWMDEASSRLDEIAREFPDLAQTTGLLQSMRRRKVSAQSLRDLASSLPM